MDESKTLLEKLNLKIKNNPVIAALIIFGTIVIALSTFTDAAKSLLGFINIESRPDINGEWVAEITYDWQNAKYNEKFNFKGEGTEVYGTVSLFRSDRGISEGQVSKNEIQFVMKAQEILGSDDEIRDVFYRYKGKIEGDEIKFVLLIDGGYSSHVPIEFTATRVKAESAVPIS